MRAKVAIEDNLVPVKEYFSEQGCEVKSLKENFRDCDAVVVSGQDVNFMGIEDIQTDAPVIDARGLRPEEVYSIVKERLETK